MSNNVPSVGMSIAGYELCQSISNSNGDQPRERSWLYRCKPICGGNDLVMKIIRSRNDGMREYNIHNNLKGCRGILKVEKQFIYQNMCGFITKICNEGSLRTFLDRNGPLTETEVRSIGKQLGEALQDMHSRKYVHRDINPTNILLHRDGDGSLKAYFNDLGDACLLSSNQVTSRCGAAGYVAPEVVQGDRYSESSDVWALGITLSEACRGCDFGDSGPHSLSVIFDKMTDDIPAHRMTVDEFLSCIGEQLTIPEPNIDNFAY